MVVSFSQSHLLGWRSCRVCHSASFSLSLRPTVDRPLNGMGLIPASSDA